VIWRLLLLTAGAAALAASLAIERPERFSVTAPCALVAIVVAAGAIAADSVPLRLLPLACSAGSLGLGLALLLGRGDTQVPIAAGIVALQVIALVHRRRRSPTGPGQTPSGSSSAMGRPR
jgi:hypothetical protein